MKKNSNVCVFLMIFVLLVIGSGGVAADEPVVEPGFIQLNLREEMIDSFFEVRVDEGEEVYLPLQGVLDIVELQMFNIRVEEGYVTGIIPQLQQEYYFDIDSGLMQCEGETVYTADADSYFIENDFLYLHYDLWEKWLPITVDWDLSRYEMYLEPDFKLIGEIFAEREEELESPPGEELKRDIKQPEPTFFTPGLVYYHGTLGTDLQEFDFSGLKLEYSGQLFYGDFTGGLQIMRDGSVNNYFQQKYYPPFLEEVVIGDTFLNYPDVLADTRDEVRGLRIRNIPDDFKFGRAEITGSVPPGSTVDLYYRNILLDYQESERGDFAFTDIPVQGFANRYEIVVYTPEGNIYTEERRLVSQPEQLTPGQYTYSLGTGFREGQLLSAGEINYGMTSNLSLGTGFYSLFNGGTGNTATFFSDNRQKILGEEPVVSRKRENYFKAGFSARPFEATGFYTDFYFSDNSRGLIYESEINHLLDNWFLTFDLEGYRGLKPSAREQRMIDGVDNHLDHRAGLSIRQRAGDYNFSLNYDVEDYSGYYEHAISAGTRLQPFSRTLVTVNGEYAWSDFGVSRQEVGSRIFYSGLENNDLRADMGLVFEEGNYQQSSLGVELTADRDNDIDYRFRLNYSNGKITPRASLTYQVTDNLTVSGSAGTDDFRLGISFGDVRRAVPPFASTGGSSSDQGLVTGRVFLDQSGTGSWQEGEPVFSDVEIMVDGESAGIYTDENGKFRISGLPVYEPVSIAIAATGLDALQVPLQEEVFVEPRPGVVLQQDLPVVSVSGIDGFLIDFQEVNIIPNQVVVTLFDQEGNQVLTTGPEFDGFFILEGIKPGKYSLTLQVPEAVDFHPQEYEIEIPSGEPVWLSGKSFTFKEETIKEETEQ